jgi:alpha-1,3-mannosyltransferase
LVCAVSGNEWIKSIKQSKRNKADQTVETDIGHIKNECMEVVHVVRQYRPSVGGLEDAVQNLCAHLSRREGIAVRIVTLEKVFTHPDVVLPKHEIIDGIPITRLKYMGSNRYPLAPQILREIASADIVHVHAVDFFFDYLALTKPVHRKPLVASTHGGFFHSSFASKLKKLWFHTITPLSANAYEALCTSSDNDAEIFSHIAPNKITTIENGVNVDKWYGVGSQTPVRSMIFIGRWSENKAVPVLIDVIAALKNIGHLWSLTIVGIPGAETASSLRAYAEAKGVGAQIDIHEGPGERQIGNLIGQASYIASASRYEGFGISAIEGLSAGLVPLLSPIPPFQKLHRSLPVGAMIDEHDLEQSARNIEIAHTRLIAAPDVVRTTCMKLARSYDWSNVTDRFVDVYHKARQRSSA